MPRNKRAEALVFGSESSNFFISLPFVLPPRLSIEILSWCFLFLPAPTSVWCWKGLRHWERHFFPSLFPSWGAKSTSSKKAGIPCPASVLFMCWKGIRKETYKCVTSVAAKTVMEFRDGFWEDTGKISGKGCPLCFYFFRVFLFSPKSLGKLLSQQRFRICCRF